MFEINYECESEIESNSLQVNKCIGYEMRMGNFWKFLRKNNHRLSPGVESNASKVLRK